MNGRSSRARCATIRGWRRLTRSTALLALCALSACTLADNFSDHSLAYNRQAEITKNQNLLVNIVRAAYRRPLQFTDLSSITAQLSVTGTAGFSIPFWGTRAGGAELSVVNPTVTASNAPTYTVAVLNTKEFYQGILAPIPLTTFSYYVHIGFPRYLLMSLLISEVEYGSGDARKVFRNDPRTRTDGAAFPELLHDLVAMGLTTEDIRAYTRLGAPFDKYPDPKDIVDLDAKNIRVVSLGARFQLEKMNTVSRFCFDPKLAEGGHLELGMPIGKSGQFLAANLLCGADPDPAKDPPPAEPHGRPTKSAKPRIPDDTPPRAFIRTRSTEGVIYYLGEIARLQLRLGPPAAQAWDPGIFKLREGPGPIEASYEGKEYHVDVDTGGDSSAQVLELVTELLSQNNSAKDLPLPSVIPVAR